MDNLQLMLEKPFPPERIHWRVGARKNNKTKGIPLAYIDARDVMRRLDEACGFAGWQNRYNLADNGLLICEIGIRIEGEWIWKANGAGDTQVEAEKGKASDAFKRAAVQWGIGRYLYSLPNDWLGIDQYGKFTSTPTLPHWATPEGWTKAMLERVAGWSTELAETVAAIKAAMDVEDYPAAAQHWCELTDEEQAQVWLAPTKFGPFTTAERKMIQEDFRRIYHGEDAT